MKRNANTTAATKAAVAQHTTTERKSAERSTTMRNANTTAAKAAVATKPAMTIDADTGWKFTPASIALNGHVFAADKYAIADKGDVYVLAKVEGVALRIHVGKASPVYHEALEAAVAFTQPKAEKPAEKPAEPAKPVEAKPATKRKAPAKAAKQPKAEKPAEQPAAEPAKPVETKAAEPAKQAKPATKRKAPAKAAKQPKAEKPAETKPAAEPAKPVATADAWIGTTIEGKGWRIVFDDATQRTRVIVDDDVPNEERVLIAVADAGFFWSNTTKSWNKKLTRKAYRAAKLLAETLNAIK